MVSLSVLLQVLILPIMGAIADYTHLKKRIMGLFAFIGAFATMGLYFLNGTNYLMGGALFLLANLSFGAAMICYNAFLPDIAEPDERDKVSSFGWALGYLGGGTLLALNLVFYTMRESLGISTTDAVRISLASAGIWWALFTLIPISTLANRLSRRQLPTGERYLTIGFKQFGRTLRGLPRVSADAALSGGLPSLQRWYSDDHCALCPIWQRRAGDGRRRIATAFSNGAVCGLFWCAALWHAGAVAGGQEVDPDQPGDLAGRDRLCIFAAIGNQQAVLCHGCGDSYCVRRQPGTEPVSLLSDDPQKPGDRVLQPLRDQRTRHQLAWTSVLRAGHSVDRQLSNCRLDRGSLFPGRDNLAAHGRCATGDHRSGERSAQGDLIGVCSNWVDLKGDRDIPGVSQGCVPTCATRSPGHY